MELDLYQNNFETNEINLVKYLITIAIFIICLVLIVLIYNKFYYYYEGNAFFYEENNINTLVNIKDLTKLTKNKKIIIEGTTFTYEIVNISDEIFENETNIYKKVFLKINDLPSNINIKNNYINYKIITRKDTISNYVFKTIFGGMIWKN